MLLVSTWFYFLVFAQFAFLHKVEVLSSPQALQWILGGMTLFGVGGALLAGARCRLQHLSAWIVWAQVLAVFAGVLAAFARSSAALWLPSALTGLSLGVLTVAVVAWLGTRYAKREAALLVGVGTGLAYFLANVPTVFQARPEAQCIVAAAICGLGAFAIVGRPVLENANVQPVEGSRSGWRLLALAVLVFGGLVWVDSGAFTWMQTVELFRDAGWANASSLWSIGIVHLLVAIATGYYLSKGGSIWASCLWALGALLVGYVIIVVAQLGLPGVWVYMTGVSIYSTALVAYPLLAFGSRCTASTAGWLFALAGWLASASGIGMVQDLGRMPASCWAMVAVVVSVAAWPSRKGQWA